MGIIERFSMKSVIFISSVYAMLLLVTSSSAHAHHGKDFFTTASLQLPRQSQWFGILSSDYVRSPVSVSLEPGILYGITNYWSIETHAHLEEFNVSPSLASIGLEQRFMLWDNTKAGKDESKEFPIAIGVLLEFEKGLGHHHDGVELRGLFTYVEKDIAASVNLIGVKEFHAEPLTAGYAIGVRRNVLEFLAIGLEARGRFDDVEKTILTPNVFLEFSHALNLLVGSSISLAPQSENPLLRATVLYGF